MKSRPRLKILSKRTRDLLTAGEDEHVDYKRTVESISVEDLVAFANMAAGGTLLVGVDEETGPDGTQRGKVVGCDAGDQAQLQILNKAQSCIPPIALEVHIENLTAKPVLRIVVLPSASRPHCTAKGIYCRRDGNRNRPLHPAELLKIFLETEANTFAARFESAAARMSKEMARLESSLDSSIRSMSDQLGWADSKLGDTESTLGSVQAEIHLLHTKTSDLATRMRTLFRQDKRDDPVRATVKENWTKRLVNYLLENPTILAAAKPGAEFKTTLSGKEALELTKEEAGEALNEAVTRATEIVEAKKYAFDIKSPSQATEAELDSFVALVTEGGEVAPGLRQRVEAASVLGLLRYNKKIIGTAALKKPITAYRLGVFEKAGLDTAEKYPLELGWIYVAPQHRGKKRTRPLLEAVVSRAKQKGVYATTRVSNEAMRKILLLLRFAPIGVPFDSQQNPGEQLQLYGRIENGGSD